MCGLARYGYLNYIGNYSRMVSSVVSPYGENGLGQVRSKDRNPQYASVNSIDFEEDEDGAKDQRALSGCKRLQTYQF